MPLDTEGNGASRPDSDRMNQITLTAEQQQFAEEHHATIGGYCTGNQAICLYGAQRHQTIRWIVDDHGILLEATAFKRSA